MRHDDVTSTEVLAEVDDDRNGGPESEEATHADADRVPGERSSRAAGWGRVLRGNRALWLVALGAVVSLVVGLLVGRFVIPAEASADDAPEPGLVTAPVQYGTLTNDVTLRADVGYADAVDVKVDTSALSGGDAVVTGRVPEVGAVLDIRSIALEVSGRPLIVLPGELPAYRTLSYGLEGPDVLQLKQALAAAGLEVGDVTSNVFDRATADAVGQLYAQAGYSVPEAAEGSDEAVSTAEQGVRAAEDGVTAAEKALREASAGPTVAARFDADVAVAAAEQALADAQANGGNVQQAQWDLQKAKLARDEALAAKDTSAEKSAVESAKESLASAKKTLEKAEQEALPFLPASEVLFLTALPRRVDTVAVQRGDVLTEAAMTVSGATVRLTGAVAESDAGLLKSGGEATFELPDGTAHRAVVASVEKGEGESPRWQVLLDPDPLTPEQLEALKGTNVRVDVPVGATAGEVLSVPVSAVTAGPGGESRVEVVDSDPREGDDAETHLVTVKTGLAAKGAVEVTPVEGELEEGDLVVVGR